MFDILQNLFDLITEFLSNIDRYATNVFNWMQLIIELPIEAIQVFDDFAVMWPSYIIGPLSAILSIVLVLRLWAIITSGG